MLIKKKPVDDTTIIFPKMGAKPQPKKPEVESAVEDRQPGDRTEDTKQTKKNTKKHTTNFYAKKAAQVLVKGNK